LTASPRSGREERFLPTSGLLMEDPDFVGRSEKGFVMQITISRRFQVVIPKVLRERLDLRPQQKLTILEKGGILYLVPDQEVKALRGIASGVAVDNYRDKSDRT